MPSRTYTFEVYDRVYNINDRVTVRVTATDIESARETAVDVGVEVLEDTLGEVDESDVIAEFDSVEVDAT